MFPGFKAQVLGVTAAEKVFYNWRMAIAPPMKQLRGGRQQEVPTFSPSAKMFCAKVVSNLYSSLENYKI